MTIPTHYPSKADQNAALDSLSRSYEKLARGIPNGLDLPCNLCHYRPAKHDRLVSREIALQIKGMIVAREVIKATPIVKPLPAKQRREAEITLNFGENASLKAAMLGYAPALAAQFASSWREQIARRVARGDHQLVYISRGVSEQVRESNNDRYFAWQEIEHRLHFANGDGTVREDKLEAAAEAYGEETALGWYWKMAAKLGRCVDVKAVTDPTYATLYVEGTVANSRTVVAISQQIVYKVSSMGRPFHQFPARIYVDRRFMTEAEFAKAFHPGVAS
jgi:hypothetical protein